MCATTGRTLLVAALYLATAAPAIDAQGVPSPDMAIDTPYPVSTGAWAFGHVPGSDAAPARAPRRRDAVDPDQAARRALFFPGGGHLYAGETGRGAMLLVGAAGAVLAGALLSSGGGPCEFDYTVPGAVDRCAYDHNTHESVEPTNRTPLWLGVAAGGATWTYGIVDARRSAHRMNTKNGFAMGSVEVGLSAGPRVAAAGGGHAFATQIRLTW